MASSFISDTHRRKCFQRVAFKAGRVDERDATARDGRKKWKKVVSVSTRCEQAYTPAGGSHPSSCVVGRIGWPFTFNLARPRLNTKLLTEQASTSMRYGISSFVAISAQFQERAVFSRANATVSYRHWWAIMYNMADIWTFSAGEKSMNMRGKRQPSSPFEVFVQRLHASFMPAV